MWRLDGQSINNAKEIFHEWLHFYDPEIEQGIWENVHLSYEGATHCEYSLYLKGNRWETDKEYKLRMKELRNSEEAQAKRKERDLKELARLKKKYEST